VKGWENPKRPFFVFLSFTIIRDNIKGENKVIRRFFESLKPRVKREHEI